ncbi:MAG: glycosyltransferase family 1 protein [Sphingobacteriales bacterium]|nr:MAG: glycosyltransferase family 1 protein [Sphingobacteriales bacterium]
MKLEKFAFPKNLLCFSHLRWDFVFQRPQHLMSRFAQETNVFVLEEPIWDTQGNNRFVIDKRTEKLTIITPHLTHQANPEHERLTMRNLLTEFLKNQNMADWIFWYYTPMALMFSDNHGPALTVFDCMDELSAFDFAPPELLQMEKALLTTADIVFTGGHSLHEAKKGQHNNIHIFPSSIDKEHFAQARTAIAEPADQARIEGIKLGFFGVIDERFDSALINEIAVQRSNWQLILLGPVVKVPWESLPHHPNIHYLGQKSYKELPAYLSGWDIAMIPFAINASTRFISPTKTPEYLAAGKRVVSTPIRDVVQPYGISGLVSISSNAEEFISEAEKSIALVDKTKWLASVDLFLKDKSWDNTFAEMKQKMLSTLLENNKLLAS